VTPSGAWKFAQRFSLRASTLLLLYFPLLICLGYVSNQMSGQVAIYVALFVGASGQRFAVLMLIAAIFGLAFFVASVVKRNPQFQFLIEALIAGTLIVVLPV